MSCAVGTMVPSLLQNICFVLSSKGKVTQPWSWKAPAPLTHVLGYVRSLDMLFWPGEHPEEMKVHLDPTILLCDSASKSEQNGVKGLSSSRTPQRATGS